MFLEGLDTNIYKKIVNQTMNRKNVQNNFHLWAKCFA